MKLTNIQVVLPIIVVFVVGYYISLLGENKYRQVMLNDQKYDVTSFEILTGYRPNRTSLMLKVVASVIEG